jgi:hypothetical protein
MHYLPVHPYNILRALPSFTKQDEWEEISIIYWCVAYLPSEASIIEHWTYTFHYRISYTFIKQCETLKIV